MNNQTWEKGGGIAKVWLLFIYIKSVIYGAILLHV